MVKNEEAENRNLNSTTCPQILEEQSFGVHTDKSPKICTHVEQIFLFKAGLSLNIDVAVSFFKSTKMPKLYIHSERSWDGAILHQLTSSGRKKKMTDILQTTF